MTRNGTTAASEFGSYMHIFTVMYCKRNVLHKSNGRSVSPLYHVSVPVF